MSINDFLFWLCFDRDALFAMQIIELYIICSLTYSIVDKMGSRRYSKSMCISRKNYILEALPQIHDKTNVEFNQANGKSFMNDTPKPPHPLDHLTPNHHGIHHPKTHPSQLRLQCARNIAPPTATVKSTGLASCTDPLTPCSPLGATSS